jgi:hypothetical protein
MGALSRVLKRYGGQQVREYATATAGKGRYYYLIKRAFEDVNGRMELGDATILRYIAKQ